MNFLFFIPGYPLDLKNFRRAQDFHHFRSFRESRI